MSTEDRGICTSEDVTDVTDVKDEVGWSWPHEDPGVSHITYAELLVELSNDPRAERNDRYVLGEWLAFNGLSMDSPVGQEFEVRRFERNLTKFTNEVSKTKAKKTAQNLSSRLRVLQKSADQLRFGRGLPPTLSEAIQAALKRLGKSINWLGSTKTEARNGIEWAKGISTPRKNEKNQASIKELEIKLALPEGVLASRAWPPVPGRVVNLSDDVPYRRYLTFVLPHPYGLKYPDMPKALQSGLDQLIEHRRQAEHLLPSGDVVVMDREHIWNSDATVKMRVEAIQRFFGFLLLPKPPANAKQLPWDQAIRFGLGYAKEDLRMTLLVDFRVIFEYMKFAELRTFDLQHFLHFEEVKEAERLGLTPPPSVNIQKSLPSSIETFLACSSGFVNKPTSFFRLHPEFGDELQPPVPREKWEEWCLDRHKQICKLIEIAKKRVSYNKRSNKAVLGVVMRQEDPRVPFIQMVEAMKMDFPPATQPSFQARRWRDITIISLLNFECLRIKNMCWLDIDKHLVERSGRLWLEVPKHEMKNDIWGHAEDIKRQLPDDLEEVVRTWISVYRPLFRNHEKTRALFLSAQTNPVKKPGVDPYRIKELALSNVVAKNTEKYFGVAVRGHAFRNVNVTSVIRHGGSISQAKAVLNDSAKTAEKVYADVKNVDENRALEDHYKKSLERAGIK